jgi:hypothetical protein
MGASTTDASIEQTLANALEDLQILAADAEVTHSVILKILDWFPRLMDTVERLQAKVEALQDSKTLQ